MPDRMVNDPSKLARLMALAERAGVPFHAPGTSPQAQGFTPMEGPTNMNVPGDWERTPYEAGYMPMEGPPPVWQKGADDAMDFVETPEQKAWREKTFLLDQARQMDGLHRKTLAEILAGVSGMSNALRRD